MYRARAFKEELRSRAFRGSATGACARVPADQSARLPISPGLIGRSDPSHAQGSGAKSRGTRRAECGDCHPLGETAQHSACRARRPRADLRPGITRGNRRRGSWPASSAPRWRASFGLAGARAPWRRPSSSRARGDAAGARGVTGLADAAPRVTERGLAREPGRGGRAGAARARPIVVARHAACPRGQAREADASPRGAERASP